MEFFVRVLHQISVGGVFDHDKIKVLGLEGGEQAYDEGVRRLGELEQDVPFDRYPIEPTFHLSHA